jgi:hypothetical protein
MVSIQQNGGRFAARDDGGFKPEKTKWGGRSSRHAELVGKPANRDVQSTKRPR